MAKADAKPVSLPTRNRGPVGSDLRSVVQDVTEVLRGAGLEAPHREARRLTETVLALEAGALIKRPDLVLSREERLRLDCAVQRRAKGEPLSRIISERWFYGRPFQVSPDVLDPRPDSETLIDVVLEHIKRDRSRGAPRLVDLGTGSGCLALTLLGELPTAQGIGIDVSSPALETAARNAVRLGLSARFQTIHRDGFVEATAKEFAASSFDVLVSNPPYIARDDLKRLDRAVRDYDPVLALDGGMSGFDFYRALAPLLTVWVPNGLAVLECGAGMADDVVKILKTAVPNTQIEKVSVHRDLNGIDRCVAVWTRTCAASKKTS
ncbi:MAG: peptide chain release factor N(5)-glutamine methyltransferase [Pseudomonadota bacterium]